MSRGRFSTPFCRELSGRSLVVAVVRSSMMESVAAAIMAFIADIYSLHAHRECTQTVSTNFEIEI